MAIFALGKIDFGGIVREARLDFLPEAQVGDYVLVHVGIAISRIDPDEARRTLELLREAGLDIDRTSKQGAAVKYLDEYRDAQLVRQVAADITRAVTRPWVLMEICGGQTHTIMRYGLDTLLPPALEIVHGPGCPVCVTALETVDKAIDIASRPGVIFVSYGDMLRVPGSEADLFTVRARGGDVRVVYSPLEALKLARANPDQQVVFFAIGFETTAPAHALAVHEAKRTGIANFSVIVSHVRVPPAIRGLLSSPDNRVQGFIAPGHVCAVMGFREYEELSRDYRVPIVVGGFEPLDILEATRMLVAQLESGRAEDRKPILPFRHSRRHPRCPADG